MADYTLQLPGAEIDARLAKVPQLESALAGKQDTLVSGTNIKTVGGTSILGSGDIPIQPGDTNAVKYVSQSLTDAQKAQARTNIAAASAAELGQIVTDLTGIEADIDSLEAAVQAINVGDYLTATTLPTASASTMGHIYLIGPDANNNYDRYYTQQSGSTYSWVALGSTQIDLSTYATQEEISQLEAKVGKEETETPTIEQGGISSANGQNSTSTKRLRTNGYITAERLYVNPGTGKAYAFGYNASDTFVGKSDDWFEIPTNVAITNAVKYRLCFSYVNDASITPANYDSLGVEIVGIYGETVRIERQHLSDNEKQIVRENIDAASGPLLDEVFGKVSQLYPTIQVTGQYIKDDGTTASATNYVISSPIAIKKGQKVTIHSYIPKNAAGLALTNATGSSYSPVLVNHSTGAVMTKEYIAPADCYVAWCYITSQTHEMFLSVSIDIYGMSGLQGMIDEVYGKVTELSPSVHLTGSYIKDDGTIGTATNYVICEPVSVKRGEKITITSYIPKNGCGLALTDAGSTSYTPVIINTGNGKVMTNEYVATEDCLVAWSFITSKTNEMHLSAAVNMNEMYNLYKSVSPHIKTGINDFNTFNEFMPKFLAAKKETGGVAPLVLCAFTDIHSKAPENLPRILEFAGTYQTKIDQILNLGDSVSNKYADDFDFENIEGAGDILTIIGNHDTADYSGGVYDWTAHAGIDAYNKFIAPFVSNWDVTQPENADTNGYCYYYKDYATQDIRLVFLDVMGYDATEESWLESVLADANTNNLSVLIVAHYAGAKVTGYDGKYSPLVDNFVNRASYNPNFYGSVSVIETFIDGGGKFIGWLTGHFHEDLIGKLDETNQVCLVADTAQFGQYAASPEYDKVEGTPTQDAFSIVCIDTQAKTLSTFKVGCRRDKWQRTRDSVCVNYETATVLCEN